MAYTGIIKKTFNKLVMISKIKTGKGFTLIEVVVVMAIIAVLASLVVGAIRVARNVVKETTHRSNAKTIQTALEAKYTRDKKYNNVDSTEWYDFSNAVYGTGSYKLFSDSVTLAAAPECASGITHNTPPGAGLGLYGGGVLQVTKNSYIIYIANAACDDALTETLRSQ